MIIAFSGVEATLSRLSFLDGVLLFDGWWREGEPVCKETQEKNIFNKHSCLFSCNVGEANKSIIYLPTVFADLMSSSFLALFSCLTHRPLECDVGHNIIMKRASSSITVLFAVLFNIEWSAIVQHVLMMI